MKYSNRNPFEKLADDEPWFFIRAKDALSVPAVLHYASLLANIGDLTAARAVADLAEEFKTWQNKNKDKVRNPD